MSSGVGVQILHILSMITILGHIRGPPCLLFPLQEVDCEWESDLPGVRYTTKWLPLEIKQMTNIIRQ